MSIVFDFDMQDPPGSLGLEDLQSMKIFFEQAAGESFHALFCPEKNYTVSSPLLSNKCSMSFTCLLCVRFNVGACSHRFAQRCMITF